MMSGVLGRGVVLAGREGSRRAGDSKSEWPAVVIVGDAESPRKAMPGFRYMAGNHVQSKRLSCPRTFKLDNAI
jgi:hypothetical protein